MSGRSPYRTSDADDYRTVETAANLHYPPALQMLIDKCDIYCGADARYHRPGCGLMKHNGEAALRLMSEMRKSR